MRNALLISLLVLILAPPHASAVTKGDDSERRRVAPDLVVAEAVFGYVDRQTGEIIEADRIDTSVHKGFGWRLKLRGARRTVHFREEFVLPAPAKTWQVGHETTVAPDRASAVTQGSRALDRTMILRNAWFHSPGDPTGKHVTRVRVEGVLVKEFHYILY